MGLRAGVSIRIVLLLCCLTVICMFIFRAPPDAGADTALPAPDAQFLTAPTYTELRGIGLDLDALASSYAAYISSLDTRPVETSQAALDTTYLSMAYRDFATALATAGVTWLQVNTLAEAQATADRMHSLGFGTAPTGNGTPSIIYVITSASTIAQVQAALSHGSGVFYNRAS